MSDRQWYEEYQQELRDQQGGKSRAEIRKELESAYEEHIDPVTGEKILEKKFEHVFDPDAVPAQGHRWIDRGLKMSCEGAGHPYHQSWKFGGHMKQA
jgi:hypothetical protein